MKLVTYSIGSDAKTLAGSDGPKTGSKPGGLLVENQIYDLEQVSDWLGQRGQPIGVVRTLLDFVALPPENRQILNSVVAELTNSGLETHDLSEVQIHAPIQTPSAFRDFYAFEQHAKTARANRGLGMIPEWYDFPVYYFSNHRAICDPEEAIPYPRKSKALDFELELGCVIGATGRDIRAEDGPSYIAGYMIINDWSSRDLQMEEMKLSMGPVKGKDFATSFGPWLVTPDELADRRVGEGATERYDLTMVARLNGKEISRGNFKDIYYSFPQMIERASLNAWLVPGDVLGSGTVGTGCLLEQGDKREGWLQPGDIMELEIDRLGILRNPVVAAREEN